MTRVAGMGALVRLGLRRDRVLLSGWIVGLVAMAGLSASATIDLYPNVADRVAGAAAINRSAALVALYGRIYDPTSIGEISMIKMGGFGGIFVAMLSVVLVVRHTRAEEDSGRAELVGALPVGRAAPLAAALAIVAITDLVLAIATALALVVAGLPAGGSLAFGLAFGAVGLAFGAVAAVAAQVAGVARAATALSAAVLVLTYVIRGVGDAAGWTGLNWLSPIGWSLLVRPYAGTRWAILVVPVAFGILGSALAFWLEARRDQGAGAFAGRPGPAHGGPRLAGPGALAWRIHRTMLAGWAVGFALVGGLVGSLASDVGDFATSQSTKDLFERLGGHQALTDAYLALELSVAGMVAAAFGIQVVARMRAEEVDGRAEPVLATAVSRLRWAGSHLVVAFGGMALLLVAVGASAGLADGLRRGDLGQVVTLTRAALIQLPAASLVTVIVVGLFGLAPRRVVLGWAVFVAFVLVGELGPLLDLGSWFTDLSPFTHTPHLPGGSFDVRPVLAMVVLAMAGLALGLGGLRRRDIA